MDLNPLTNEDVADILALLDSLPYDELDLQTPRFRLTLRRTPGGWTQSTQVLSAPERLATTATSHRGAPDHGDVTLPSSAAGAGEGGDTADEAEVVDGADGDTEDGDGGVEGTGDGGSGDGDGDADEDAELVAVRAPLPGTFYRAPRPGAAPFVEVGSRVEADTVIGIVETMKLMNSVHAGVAGVVAGFCVANAEFAAQGAALLRIRADR
jgi:acetyl-CoA carboxylase biotin carboxyl carrier protein